MVPMSYGEIRITVSKALYRRLRQSEWDELCDSGMVDEVVAGRGSSQFEDLVESALEILDKPDSENNLPIEPNDERHPDKLDEVARAFAWIQAIRARRLPEVIQFRRDVLGDKCIDRDNIAAWLRARSDEEGGGTLYVEVGVPADMAGRGGLKLGDWREAVRNLDSDEPVNLRSEYLSFPVPGSKYSDDVRVTRGGCTSRIKELAGHLAKTFGWQKIEAVTFLLADRVPLPPLGRIRNVSGLKGLRPPHIELDVDARLSPARLKEEYRKVRRYALSLDPDERYKTVAKKASELAVFLAETPHLHWPERVREWNQRYPKWEYSKRKRNRKRFPRDARRSFECVTGMAWDQNEWD